MAKANCSYSTCDRVSQAKGYCSVHYYQWRRTGTVFDIVTVEERRKPNWCSVDGCEGRHFARGWCQDHHAAEYTRYARYGLTRESFEALLNSQGGLCAICNEVPDVVHVDHDHQCCPGLEACGRCVRGLLCRKCNLGIGGFKDDPIRLRAAAAYLEDPKGQQALLGFELGRRKPPVRLRAKGKRDAHERG